MVVKKVQQAPEFANRKVASLETSDFKRYRSRVTAQGSSDSTVNNHFALIRAALNLERKQTPSRVAKVPHETTSLRSPAAVSTSYALLLGKAIRNIRKLDLPEPSELVAFPAEVKTDRPLHFQKFVKKP
jgi:hypothetical protein